MRVVARAASPPCLTVLTDRPPTSLPDSTDELPRVLGLRDLVLLNVSSIVALSSIAQVAQFGYASLSLFAVARS